MTQQYEDRVVAMSVRKTGEVLCPECYVKSDLIANRDVTFIYRVNIGIYSQDCHRCNRLIVEGAEFRGKPTILFDRPQKENEMTLYPAEQPVCPDDPGNGRVYHCNDSHCPVHGSRNRELAREILDNRNDPTNVLHDLGGES